MARKRNTQRRSQLFGEDGRRLVAVSRTQGEQIRRDQEDLMFRAMQEAPPRPIAGPMRMSEIRAIAGEYGPRRRFLLDGRHVVSLVGNFVDHAHEKFQQYADVHDRRAVTVRADRKIWIPDATQAAKRGKQYAQGAKN